VSFARFVAAGLGTGFAPLAPGTVASAVGVLTGAALLWCSPLALLTGVVIVAFGGVWAVRAARIEGDPSWVVIDEVAGQWLALLGLATVTPIALLVAFLLFRLLDVTKLGPIGWADRQKGAVGVMADDLLAGALCAGILWAIRTCWPDALG